MALPTEDGEIQHQCELSFPEQSVGKELASKLGSRVSSGVKSSMARWEIPRTFGALNGKIPKKMKEFPASHV